MKIILRLTAVLTAFIMLLALCGCEKFDENYGKSMSVDNGSDKASATELIYPEIKSSDEVMPKYFDISRFDEENYSNIYLGKRFKFSITYAGSVFSVPTTFSKVQKEGWQLSESGQYSKDSVITAGKNIEAELYNEYDKRIVAIFYNSSKSSKKLTKCE